MSDNQQLPAECVHVNHSKAERVAAGYRELILAQVGKGRQNVIGQIDHRDLLLLIDAYEEALAAWRHIDDIEEPNYCSACGHGFDHYPWCERKRHSDGSDHAAD